MRRTDDLRIREMKELLPPSHLIREFAVTEKAGETVAQAREKLHAILHGMDDRVMVVIGPCSIHDTKAAMEYARLLEEQRRRFSGELEIVMRVYFEKPRTTVGWKGLINDPYLDNSFRINDGLRMAREMLLEINELGLPAGTEFLDVISPQYIADLISWGAIGARTTESQQHHFLSVTKCVHSSIVSTNGNEDCHVILRGGKTPNYDAASVDVACRELGTMGLASRLMIDASHANSSKKPENQVPVCADIAQQIAAGNTRIVGVMVESHLKAGRQDLVPGKELEYGKSVTDGCIDWATSVAVLENLAQAVRQRRLQVVGAEK